MMEIKNSRILYAAPVATFFLLVIRKPFVMSSDQSLFRTSIAITTFTATIDLGRRSQSYSKRIFRVKPAAVLTAFSRLLHKLQE